MSKTDYFCAVCGSENTKREHTLFNFPKSPNRKEKWLNILKIDGKDLRTRSRVCQMHFSQSQLVRDRLKRGALPRSNSDANTSSHKSSLAGTADQNHKYVEIYPKLTSSMVYTPLQIQMPVTAIAAIPMTPMHFNAESVTTTPVSPKNHSKCRRQLYDVKKRLAKLKDKMKQQISVEKVFGSNPVFRDILLAQIHRYKNKLSPYSPFEKTMAMSLYYSCGHNGYR
ncbi:unnamed protein product [Orchesella dallaii]|uniref:THAP-type domain-containing protein n=1 Tax=Orchesella dallaii TaxID=48710 RepID=A0ABP1RUV0_9HEXA